MPKDIFALIKNNIFLIAFLLLGVIAFLLKETSPSPVSVAPTENDAPSADTYIPRGYVLVPVELANAESLTSLVGSVGGVVDLYLATTDQQKGGLKVASRLKLLRAPLNPDRYAVLVRDEESVQLLRHSGPFMAVVQNPHTQGSQVQNSTRRRVQIDYQN